MANLIDIGGGLKMADLSQAFGGGGQVNPLDLVEKRLSISKLQAETQLKINEVMNIETRRLKQRAELHKVMGEIQRQEIRFKNDQLSQLIELAKKNPEAAVVAGQGAFPSASFELRDGTIAASFPMMRTVVDENGQFKQVPAEDTLEVVFDPNRLSTDKRLEIEGRYFDRFQQHASVKRFDQLNQQFKVIQSASQKGTGAGDNAIINAFSRMVQGGTGLVTESDVRNAMQTVGLTKQVENRIVQAWLEGGPIFGDEVPGTARQNFVNAAKDFYQNARGSALVIGQDFVDKALRQGLDPENIVGPVGDISRDEFFETDSQVLDGLRRSIGGR